MDFVSEGYMRSVLNKEFPLWSWEIKKYELLGDKEVIVHGRLTINDNNTVRFFDAVASHRIAVSKTTGEYVDISNNIKAANSDCFKVATNRLCNVADDVYRKLIRDLSLTEEQVDIIDGLLETLNNTTTETEIRSRIASGAVNTDTFDKYVNMIKDVIKKKIEEH
jgi:hypothetical protein